MSPLISRRLKVASLMPRITAMITSRAGVLLDAATRRCPQYAVYDSGFISVGRMMEKKTLKHASLYR